jgi:hypothetical protein
MSSFRKSRIKKEKRRRILFQVKEMASSHLSMMMMVCKENKEHLEQNIISDMMTKALYKHQVMIKKILILPMAQLMKMVTLLVI